MATRTTVDLTFINMYCIYVLWYKLCVTLIVASSFQHAPQFIPVDSIKYLCTIYGCGSYKEKNGKPYMDVTKDILLSVSNGKHDYLFLLKYIFGN